MKLPTSPGLDLSWRAVALAVCDTLAVFALAHIAEWAWTLLTS